MTPPPSRPDPGEVRIRYLAGQSADTIAAALNTSRATVFRMLRATQTPTRRIGHPGHPLDARIIVESYKKGEPIAQIARAHRCHRATILRTLRRKGAYKDP